MSAGQVAEVMTVWRWSGAVPADDEAHSTTGRICMKLRRCGKRVRVGAPRWWLCEGVWGRRTDQSDDRVHVGLEAHVQHPVGLVEDKVRDPSERAGRRVARGQVQKPARSGDHDVR